MKRNLLIHQYYTLFIELTSSCFNWLLEDNMVYKLDNYKVQCLYLYTRVWFRYILCFYCYFVLHVPYSTCVSFLFLMICPFIRWTFTDHTVRFLSFKCLTVCFLCHLFGKKEVYTFVQLALVIVNLYLKLTGHNPNR